MSAVAAGSCLTLTSGASQTDRQTEVDSFHTVVYASDFGSVLSLSLFLT